MRWKKIFAVISLFTSINIAYANESSIDYKLKASISISAFECWMFAVLSENEDDTERLFNIGYRSGKIFLSGLKENKLSQKDLGEIPLKFLVHGRGPNDEFIMGRIFESTIAQTTDFFNEKVNASVDEKTRRDAAKIEYHDKNCALIKE